MKKKELSAAEFTRENVGVCDGRKPLPASPVCQCCSLGQVQCRHLQPVTDSLSWLASDLTNPTSSSLPLWPWMVLRTSRQGSMPTAKVPVHRCNLRKVQKSTLTRQCTFCHPWWGQWGGNEGHSLGWGRGRGGYCHLCLRGQLRTVTNKD